MKSFTRTLALVLVVSLFANCQKEEVRNFNDPSGEIIGQHQLKSGSESDHTVFLLNLIAQIEELGLNKGNTNALVTKISHAIKSLDKGKTKAANGQLGAFINQVTDFESEGKLTTEQAEKLIKAAQKAIDGDFSLWSPGDPFTDSRDQNVYETVLIGDQCWMAENLAYMPSVNPAVKDYSNPAYYVLDYSGSDVNEARNLENYKLYGTLYNYLAAKDACPEGWHLASDDEWTILEDLVEVYDEIPNNVGFQLKSTTEDWSWYNGDNSSGFNALPCGNFNFGFSHQDSYYWTSSIIVGGGTWNRGIRGWTQSVSRSNFIPSAGFAVRCIKDI